MSVDFIFRVCRGCLSPECLTKLTSVFNSADLSEKLQVLSGIKISCEKGKNDVLMCEGCLEKLVAAFKFGEQCRKLDVNFFQKARAHKLRVKKAQDEVPDQLAVNGFSMPMFSQSNENGNSALKESLKRKATENIDESLRKVSALDEDFFEKQQETRAAFQRQAAAESHDVSLLEEVDQIEIKEEKIDGAENLVIESNPNEFGSFFDDEQDSEAESDTEHSLNRDYSGHFSRDTEWNPSDTLTQCQFFCSWENCGKSFNSQWHLQRHGVVHMEDRPFGCFCGKAYKRKSHLVRHQKKTHQKPTERPKTVIPIAALPYKNSTSFTAVLD